MWTLRPLLLINQRCNLQFETCFPKICKILSCLRLNTVPSQSSVPLELACFFSPHLGEAPGLRPRQDPTSPSWFHVGALPSFMIQPFKSSCILEQGAGQGGSVRIVFYLFLCSLTALCALALTAPQGLTL